MHGDAKHLDENPGRQLAINFHDYDKRLGGFKSLMLIAN
jgi:hypothetical protein